MLYQYLERYTYSTFSQIFPFINPLLFEHTVQAAYGEDHPTNFAPAAAKACVFAFMSVASVALNESNNGSISNMDDYALEAYYLLPDLLGHTMTVDGLQALLMLVSLPIREMRKKQGTKANRILTSASTAKQLWAI
jgi:hypothetical protein